MGATSQRDVPNHISTPCVEDPDHAVGETSQYCMLVLVCDAQGTRLLIRSAGDEALEGEIVVVGR